MWAETVSDPLTPLEDVVWSGVVFTNVCYDIVDFETFSKVLNRPGGFREPGDIDEYVRGFQVFDKELSGFVGVGQVRYGTSFTHGVTLKGWCRNGTMLTSKQS